MAEPRLFGICRIKIFREIAMKKIISITDSLFNLFAPMLPGKLMPSRQLLLGCIDEQTPLGCAVIDRGPASCCLSWIYVPEQFRSQGVGTMLGDAACEAILASPEGVLNVSYDPDAPWSITLDGIIARLGGLLRTQKLPCFRITGEELRQSPLMQGVDLNTPVPSNIVTLHSLIPYQLRVLRSQCEQNGLFHVSRADFELADPRRSLVLLDSQLCVVGLTLVRELEEPGCLSLDLLYLAKGYSAQGLPLLRHTAAAILTDGAPFTQMQMICVNKSSEAIGLKLLGMQYRTTQALTTAQFTHEFHFHRDLR